MKTKSVSKQAFVTDGAGFIDSHPCEELLYRGLKVAAIDTFSTSSKSNIAALFKNKDFSSCKGSLLRRLDGGAKQYTLFCHAA